MNIRLSCAIAIALIATSAFAQNTRPVWKSFTSSSGFSVEYPESWFPIDDSKNSLTILSSPGGADAVIIKHDQAMIWVAEETGVYAHSRLSQVEDYYNRETEILSGRTIHNESAGAEKCDSIAEIISKEGIVPPEDVAGPVPYVINTELFCQMNGHTYVTMLKSFEGDKNQPIYQKIALHMAESLQI
jgi:hypothetical protein